MYLFNWERYLDYVFYTDESEETCDNKEKFTVAGELVSEEIFLPQSGNATDFYLGGSRFESQQDYQLSWGFS
jgi:hypothetical protein